MFHWTDSKIRVHAFYCVLALLLTSLLQRELAQRGESLSINRMLEELGGIRETLVVYPRRQGQRQAFNRHLSHPHDGAAAAPFLPSRPPTIRPGSSLGHTRHLPQTIRQEWLARKLADIL